MAYMPKHKDIPLNPTYTLLRSYQARCVVVTKTFFSKKAGVLPYLCYLAPHGGWTRCRDEARKFHNFRSAIQVQRAVRGDDACLL